MKKILSITCSILSCLVLYGSDSFGAAKKAKAPKKQSALQAGTKVRGKIEADGVYNQDCYDFYYGCMDQFCIADNENGGSCMCSDDAAKYDEQLEAIKKTIAEAERVRTEEVEKVQAGANADIIFNNGERQYNDDGTVVKVGKKKKVSTNPAKMVSLYDEEEEEEFDSEWVDIDLSNKVGKELYKSAHELCVEQMQEEENMGDSCNNDLKILTQMYSRQIISDCKGLANVIAQKKAEADSQLAEAKSQVRSALKDSLEEANKYDRGTCMVEYRNCMKTTDACGPEWENCVMEIASSNMVNNETAAGKSKAATGVKYNINKSTMERLEAKKFICEKVLDKCIAVRDFIWDDFLKDIAPTIRLAESNAESKQRQSCLGNISTCIQTACKDDIEGKGVASMDACLARPDMARSFCKVQIEPCEKMEPQIWDYVKDKLASMRVDECTKEVKDCFTAEDRCGENFINCIGMDFNYIHDMCPIDKLVACKQTNPKFSMSDLDSMLMGLYLNIDNSFLDNCQNLAEQKMEELCGSTTDCNAFAADEYLGTSSIKSQKDGTTYRVTGMISFGSIKMGDAAGGVKDGGVVLKPGEIGVQDYIKEIKKKNTEVPNAAAIISSIEEELNNIAGTINKVITVIESDQRVQYCINGRDLSQINGKSNKNGKNQTVARFPNLMNQYRVMIGIAALRKAQNNYNKKVEEAITEATKSSSADVAQYMCQKLADIGNTVTDTTGLFDQKPLTTPYSISYDVGAGLKTEALMQGGKGKYTEGGGTDDVSFDGGWRKYKVQNSGVTRERESTFNRETRTCHVCTTTTTKSCSNTVKWSKTSSDCKINAGDPVCEDIKM